MNIVKLITILFCLSSSIFAQAKVGKNQSTETKGEIFLKKNKLAWDFYHERINTFINGLNESDLDFKVEQLILLKPSKPKFFNQYCGSWKMTNADYFRSQSKGSYICDDPVVRIYGVRPHYVAFGENKNGDSCQILFDLQSYNETADNHIPPIVKGAAFFCTISGEDDAFSVVQRTNGEYIINY